MTVNAARVAKFDTELAIYEGNSSTEGNVLTEIYATSKLYKNSGSARETMVDGTCGVSRITLFNYSECTVKIKNIALNEKDNSIYTKLIIPFEMSYIEENKKDAQDNGVANSARKYMSDIMEEYNRDPAMISDENDKEQNLYLKSLFSTDADFTYQGNPLVYEIGKMKDVTYVNKLVSAVNKITMAKLCDPSVDRGLVLKPEEGKTVLILSWVEHDNVYKEDADLNAEKISHKSPTELSGARSNVAEDFIVSVDTVQYD